MRVKITAPVRIDISGGWPDSDPYRKDFGGAVLNAAICRTDMPYRTCAVLDGFSKTDLRNVLPRSGQGTSGSLRAVELAASNPNLLSDKLDLIRRVWIFENRVIGFRAGLQDEAAAIYGGVNYWEFGNGPGEETPIRRIEIPPTKAQPLEDKLVLVYFNEEHLSANIHDSVFGPGNYDRNVPMLDRMKQIASEMKNNLSGKFDESYFGRLIEETWELQKSLHSSIETYTMRKVQNALKGSYAAFRAIGAGGGGSGIFYGDRQEIISTFNKAVQESTIPSGVQIIPFRFEYEGIRIEA